MMRKIMDDDRPPASVVLSVLASVVSVALVAEALVRAGMAPGTVGV